MQTRFYEDSNFGKSDRRFYEDRLRSGRVTTASGLVLDLAVVADGIGGENAGERAAEMTIEEVFSYARCSEDKDIPTLLQTALEMANAKVYLEAQREKHKQDMGSTAVVAAIHKGRLYVANVGDSRIYLVQGRKILQLTSDHTWANEMVRDGEMTAEEANRHFNRDDLMRSIGYEPQVMVDTGLYLNGDLSEEKARLNQGLHLKQGDRVVLCSDGLIKARRGSGGRFVEPEEIVKILAESPPEESAKLLVDKALERGTDDNVSVVVLELSSMLRPVYVPKPARVVFLLLLLLGLSGLGVLLPVLTRPPAPPTLPPIVISQNQAYVSQLQNTALQFLPAGGQARDVLDGEYVDFMPGGTLRTGPAESGYVFVGLPGRAELFIAPNSEVRFITSDSRGVIIQLKSGRAVTRLPEEFPEGRRLTVYSAEWAHTWISGSSMCVWVDPQTQVFNMECVEDSCGYDDGREKFIQAGYRLEFEGSELSALGIGLHPDMCQFVPGLVPTSTPTLTPTQRPALSKPQINATTTARARNPLIWFTRTAIPVRTLTPRPTATRTLVPTRTNTPVTPTRTNTPITPTLTFTPITPSVTPITPSVTPITPSVTPITPSVTPITPSVTPITPSVTPITPEPTLEPVETPLFLEPEVTPSP